MKTIFGSMQGLSYVTKAVVILTLLIVIPTSTAVAEPMAGILSVTALSNTASTVASMQIKPVKEEKMIATFTAYTSRASETDSDPFISADGKYVYDGLIACSREYPFGTLVTVNGRTYRCGDRMARKHDHAVNLSLKQPRFDIWMDSLSEARQWGRRDLAVTISYPNAN
jgi:3D (Asp-Asp-Asp) domain-containing protein